MSKYTAGPLLSNINSPSDLRKLNKKDLPQLSDELRQFIVDVVSEKGGHFGASLGVVELTVALHHTFNTPEDQLVWDVGHQAYAHKLLTGRFEEFPSIRQYGGLSGFLKRSESEFDVFGAGHASTAISAALAAAYDCPAVNLPSEALVIYPGDLEGLFTEIDDWTKQNWDAECIADCSSDRAADTSTVP